MRNPNIETKEATEVVQSVVAGLVNTAVTRAKFNECLDDSSAESGVEEKLKNYTLDEPKYEYYKKWYSDPEEMERKRNQLPAFLMLAMGLKILYAPEVNRIYPKLRNKHLNKNTKISDDRHIIKWFMRAYKTFLRALLYNPNFQPEVIEGLAGGFVTSAEYKSIKSTITLTLKRHLPILYKYYLTDRKKFLLKLIELLITPTRQAIDNYLQRVSSQINYAPKLVDNLSDNELESMQDMVKVICQDTDKLDKHDLTKNEYNIIEQKAHHNTLPDNYIARAASTDRLALYRAFIKDLLIMDKQFQDASQGIFKQYPTDQVIRSVLRYDVTCWQADITSQIKVLSDRSHCFNEFSNKLLKTKNKISINIYRGHLPSEQVRFLATSLISFLAHVRLSNRSQKRMMKQLRDEQGQFSPETVVRKWVFGLSNKKYYALEQQAISCNQDKGVSRNDMVINMGKYEKVAEHIKTLKTKIVIYDNDEDSSDAEEKVTDADIACFIRHIIDCKPIDDLRTQIGKKAQHQVTLQTDKLVSLAYLLFGCEVARHPSALIAHQMMLDLIIAGHLTWDECLIWDDCPKKTQMPLSVSGAVGQARYAHYIFRNKLPIAYCYEGNNIDSSNTSVRCDEADLFSLWYKKIYRPGLQSSVEAKSDAEPSADDLIESLNAATIRSWYPDITI